MFKKISKFLVRVFAMIVVTKCFFTYIGGVVAIILFPLLLCPLKLFSILYDKMNIGNDLLYENVLLNIFVFSSSFISLYLLAKVFGIFKKLDELNFFIAFVIICAISYLLVMVGKFNILVHEEVYNAGLEYFYTMYFLVPAFILYKFFNLLTKKFQIFQKIGYYTSIEFVKNICGKIKGKFAKRK